MPDFRSSIIYQIYPRSFNDSNGDGEGDLMGIIQKLDYLHDLGVDILWISPIFLSPNADNGYDVSDYQAIQPAFGTMDDFDELLAGVHKRGMKLLLDLVVNHSSDEHAWFVESRKSKDNPYRDYYIWRSPKPGNGADHQPPNDWISIFSGPAWTFDEATGEYYLHLFLDKQPDLNWENPALRQEVYQMMRFWLNKGVDGFRMDVIPFISKDQSFPDFQPGRFGDTSVYANGPRVHEFLQEMNRDVLSRYDCISIGEGVGISSDQARLYVGEDRHELNMIYHFGHAIPRDEPHFSQPAPEFTLLELKRVFDTWDRAMEKDGYTGEGWQNIYFGNHDNPRCVSRFGNVERFHYESATLLATVLLTQRGTPTIYQGDEIGMTNCHFNDITEFNDVQILNAYKALVATGKVPESTFITSVNYIGRDHARTPMQWFNGPNAGFTSGRPWLKVNPNYTQINATDQQVREDSILGFYKKLTRWRRKTPAIWGGTYSDLLPEHPTVWAYERTLGEERVIVLANFSVNEVYVPQAETGEVALSNYINSSLALRPFEARILAGY